MVPACLQNIVEDIRFEDLPANWNSFYLEKFSKTKRLWGYQQDSLRSALKALWKYYDDCIDYQGDESPETNDVRKSALFTLYKDYGLEAKYDITIDKRKHNLHDLLAEYYPAQDNAFSYEHFINRISFWMATGSGKTLVIIKLIQIMKELIKRKEIPTHDFLFLTHRDDLIDQLKKHVDEYNDAHEAKIELRELREYPEINRQAGLFGFTVFFYRSDNLSEEQKEKIVDFRNYDNGGQWYVFLDEAHKGDREESKRQHIYSILSRNGFLFNFSATFVDPRDIATCAFEFNLSSFSNAGYGKHIGIMKQETRAFRDDEDYGNIEKQKIVLKSLIMLTYLKQRCRLIRSVRNDLYHIPLLLTLVNSVNVEDADLKLFFRELERIGKGEVRDEVFSESMRELWEELKEEPEFTFEPGKRMKVNSVNLSSISKRDILQDVYNSDSPGEIEVIRRLSNKKELAFKLKTSDRPFALIKIGDISGWLREELVGYEVQERYEEESYFERLNREDSNINILMGSRGFYEGWDSNRPNIINFINIGIGQDAKKFILQSVGRGVRIEPITNKRRRLSELFSAGEIETALYDRLRNIVSSIETLLVLGTNRQTLEFVIRELENERKKEGELQLELLVNEEVKKRTLLIPTYRLADKPLINKKKLKNFEITKKDYQLLKRYFTYLSDDRVLLMLYNSDPNRISILRQCLHHSENFKYGGRECRNIGVLVQRMFDYFAIVPEEFKSLKEVDAEIKHFENIRVYLKDISRIEEKVRKVQDYPKLQRELQKQYGVISPEEYAARVRDLTNEEVFETNHKKIMIQYVANHYYFPVILSAHERLNYISHIIDKPSEVSFVKDLCSYMAVEKNKLNVFDWWLFSKVDESLDDVCMPYYNPNLNRISNFYPDFVFWLKKGTKYFILFVDPKGIEHISGWVYKIDNGYRELFENENDGRPKLFPYGNCIVQLMLQFRTDDISKVPNAYKKYWFAKIASMFDRLAHTST